MHIPLLSEYKFEEAMKRLDTYTKFMFARNPHERILSAYRDKLAEPNARNAEFRSRYGKKIEQYNIDYLDQKYPRYSKRPPPHLRGSTKQYDVTFQEYIRYINDPHNKLTEAPGALARDVSLMQSLFHSLRYRK